MEPNPRGNDTLLITLLVGATRALAVRTLDQIIYLKNNLLIDYSTTGCDLIPVTTRFVVVLSLIISPFILSITENIFLTKTGAFPMHF